ncbi:MAG: hypothetical protein ACFCAD_21175 [Pleurocapsa sp.]
MICSLLLTKIMIILGVISCPLLLLLMFAWFLRLAIIEIKNKITKYKLWHNTPCPNCVYFVDYQELKCAVNPCQALTKNAHNCRDFEPIVGARVYDYRIENSLRN